jgi:hypothetical protein
MEIAALSRARGMKERKSHSSLKALTVAAAAGTVAKDA